MEEDNFKPVDPTGSERVQVGIQHSTSTISQTIDSGLQSPSSGHIIREKLMEKGAVQEVRDKAEEGFYSRLFLVPKKDGQMRPVINLRPLNQFLVHQHFKMEGMHVVKDLLQKNDWMMRIDLKDAYFLIPIDPLHQKFLGFKWQGKSFQFTCLPFGLASAPRVFTKILCPVVGFLRSKGIRCVIYLDNLLLLDQDRDKLKEHTATVLTLLEALGFLVNYPKSVLEPTQILVFVNQFCEEGAESSLRESGDNREGSQEHSGASDGVSLLSGPTGWKNVSGSSCHSPCPTALLRFTAPQAYSSEKERLRRPSNAVSRSSQGSGIVDEEPICLERESNSGPRSKFGDRNGCLKEGVGSLLSRSDDRRLLEFSGSRASHKFPGDASSILCDQGICQGSSGSLNLATH